MSKIASAFKDGKAFIGFLSGGDPSVQKTEEFIVEMIRAGVDLIEIGVPFSDPVAEGPVIERATMRALENGVTMDDLFEMVVRLRQKYDTPMVFMTYLNPVFRYGYEQFCKRCQETGLDGVIIPDMPFEEQEELRGAADLYDVDIITLIAPTSKERVEQIAKNSKGFLYLVSSMGVTGVRGEITSDFSDMTAAVRAVSDIPAAVGFGISTPQQAAEIAHVADGVIVGSAIVKIIEEHRDNAGSFLYDYVKEMKDAIR